jgi:hypothetical protein
VQLGNRIALANRTELGPFADSGRDVLMFDGTIFGVLDEAVTLSGDFEISFNILSTATDTYYMLFGASANSNYIAIETNGVIELFSNSLSFKSSTGAIEAGSPSSICLTQSGSIITCKVNGVSVFSKARAACDLVIEYIGRWASNSYYFEGIISDLVITDDGTTVLDCRIDQRGEDSQDNDADSSNNLTLSNVNDSDWYSLKKGIYTSYADGSTL